MTSRTPDHSHAHTDETVTGNDRAVHDREVVGRDTHAHDTHDTRAHGAAPVRETRTGPSGHDEARDRFGGINWGAAFFGWLVAIGLTILLTSIVGAIAAAIGSSVNVSQNAAERQAGTIGIVAAVVLLLILALAYYTGGYVAGRMSRFDGAKQGLATWLIGLFVTLLAIGLGALFGTQYNILDRVNLPTIPISTDQLSWGGVITAVVVLVVSLLAAMLGGKVGHRYHDKVDRVVRG